MSVELSHLLHAAARSEAEAAEREFPLSDDGARRVVRAARQRRLTWSGALAVGCAAAVGGIVLGAVQLLQDDDADVLTTPTPSVTWTDSASPSPSPSPSATPSATPTPSPSPTPSGSVPAQTTPPPATPEDPPAAVPSRVTVVSAGPGGGSGEVVVDWDAVEGATGYRVYRSSSSGGPFSAAVSVSSSTGATTIELGIAYDLIQVWQPTSASYQYVERVDNSPAYFKVAAFNDAGLGDPSAVVCGAPITTELTC